MNTELEKDPIVRRIIGRKVLYMRESHKLHIYYARNPLYDRALPRICKKINEIDGKLILIDIGANVGDTVSLITDEVPGSFLCMEGDSEYLSLLKLNTANIKNSNVFIQESFCSEDVSNDTYKVERFDGTAKLIAGGGIDLQNDISFMSLDSAIAKYPLFHDTNVLKIDTDGFEISVLKSGPIFLSKAMPVIYFEFVPELYLNNKQDPMFIFELLKNGGYHKALFYNNFGLPIEIVDTSDELRIKELINLIDYNKIYYYDVLTWHHSKNKRYEEVYEAELKIKN